MSDVTCSQQLVVWYSSLGVCAAGLVYMSCPAAAAAGPNFCSLFSARGGHWTHWAAVGTGWVTAAIAARIQWSRCYDAEFRGTAWAIDFIKGGQSLIVRRPDGYGCAALAGPAGD
jgi:hypothetical protein